MQETTSDSKIWIWLAGVFFMMWNGLLTIFLNHSMNKLNNISKEREDHCIPRKECERTHTAINERLDRFEEDVKSGIMGIHQRLDKIIGARSDCR